MIVKFIGKEKVMDWLQVLTIAGSTIGACWYMHRETHKEIRDLSNKFSDEMKDFHGRLCTLEEKYIQMMQRVLEGKKKEK